MQNWNSFVSADQLYTSQVSILHLDKEPGFLRQETGPEMTAKPLV